MSMSKIEEREAVVLENAGQRIFGIIHRPRSNLYSPAVLMCHGLAGHKTGKYRLYVHLSERLAEKGIASLRIDFRGSGDSEGDFSEVTLESEVSDALKGLDYLSHLPFINKDRIGIFGRSVGGTVAIMTAKRYEKAKSLATWAPLFDGDQWIDQWNMLHSPEITEEHRLTTMRVNGQVPGYAFFKELFGIHMKEELRALENIPLLHIHGEKDVIVKIEHADKYMHARQSVKGENKFIRLPQSDHDFSNPKEQQLAINETASWFADTL
jgi:uncharacterized protein